METAPAALVRLHAFLALFDPSIQVGTIKSLSIDAEKGLEVKLVGRMVGDSPEIITRTFADWVNVTEPELPSPPDRAVEDEPTEGEPEPTEGEPEPNEEPEPAKPARTKKPKGANA